MNIKQKASCLLLLCCVLNSTTAQVKITEQAEQRAKALVEKMTLEEKIDYISGVRSFYIRAIPRLGIPEIRMADGPQGIRNNTQSTMYPSGILSASTWNRELVRELGNGLGRDAKARGVSILLGPGVNIYRSPLCGRNFEYFGEDPYLSSETAKQYILGVQDKGVIATVKHFAANNQEWSRHHASSDVDERTLQEIYFPAFRKAVQEAGVGAVMDSYNPVNGVHATENAWMNIEILRKQWGFKGILMSDWTSVYSTVGAANGGLDLEMPVGKFMVKEKLIPVIENGIVKEKTIDEKVQHILQTLITFGLLDNPQEDKSIEKDNAESKATALNLAREGIVMLKNDDNVLPLKKGHTLIIGPNADMIPTGGGSGFVTPYSTVSIYEGMAQIKGDKKITLLSDSILYKDISKNIFTDNSMKIQGFTGCYFRDKKLSGKPCHQETTTRINYSWKYGSPYSDIQDDHFSAQWKGIYKADKSGTIRFQISGDDGYRILVNGKTITGDWGNHALSSRNAFIQVEKDSLYHLQIDYFENVGEATIKFEAGMLDKNLLNTELKKADNVIMCLGFDSNIESEGFDRPFALPYGQEFLIDEVTKVHNNVITVINSGGGIDFSNWENKVKAILMAWYPGQEGGKAIAEILTGKISPSGKLPISIEEKREDNPTFNNYYDTRNVPHKRVQYAEGIFVGYRGYDCAGKQPLYPFGYGLSYSKFTYSNLQLKKNDTFNVEVSFDIKNIGKMDASEVIQVYVRDCESSVPRPLKELKGFEKVFLKKGQTKHVTIQLHKDAFAFYDVDNKQFIVENGDFEILVGSSSADLPLKKKIEITN